MRRRGCATTARRVSGLINYAGGIKKAIAIAVLVVTSEMCLLRRHPARQHLAQSTLEQIATPGDESTRAVGLWRQSRA